MICMKLIELTRPIFISSLKHKEQVRRFDYNNESDLNDAHGILLTIHICYKLSMHACGYAWIVTQVDIVNTAI